MFSLGGAASIAVLLSSAAAQAQAAPTQSPELEGGVTLILVAFALLALVGDRLMTWASRVGFRLGLGSEHALGSHVRGVKWTGVLILTVVLVRWLVAPLPDWAAGLTVLAFTVGLLAVTGALGDVLGGLLVHFRLGLREGDQIVVGERKGQVEEVHLLRVRLLTLDDGSLYVPNRYFIRNSIKVDALRHAFALCFEYPLPGLPAPKQLSQLQEALLFMPYRVPNSTLRVEFQQAGGTLHVRCYLWSHRARQAAEAWLRRRCQAFVDDLPT